jgi:hypothetical protein
MISLLCFLKRLAFKNHERRIETLESRNRQLEIKCQGFDNQFARLNKIVEELKGEKNEQNNTNR